jgi:hypothetical protein
MSSFLVDYPFADLAIERIGDLVKYELVPFLCAAKADSSWQGETMKTTQRLHDLGQSL